MQVKRKGERVLGDLEGGRGATDELPGPVIDGRQRLIQLADDRHSTVIGNVEGIDRLRPDDARSERLLERDLIATSLAFERGATRHRADSPERKRTAHKGASTAQPLTHVCHLLDLSASSMTSARFSLSKRPALPHRPIEPVYMTPALPGSSPYR